MTTSTFDSPIGEWQTALDISDLPKVDEAISDFLAEPHEVSAVCMVREILRAMPKPTPLVKPQTIWVCLDR